MEIARKQHIANNQWSCVNLIFITLKSLFLRNWFRHSTPIEWTAPCKSYM